MTRIRTVSLTRPSRPTLEGAGVRLRRAFGYYESPAFDPFLMLDDFHSENPADYLAGFPWHPHRGIETITYLLRGLIEHGDSLGNTGTICSGQVQWMTAGSGIIHQEMPKEDGSLLWGFQLWTNLPAAHKMTEPRYRDIRAEDIPHVSPSPGVRVRVVCGQVEGVRGPVRDIVIDPEYLDVSVALGAEFRHRVDVSRTALAYVVEGEGRFAPQQGRPTPRGHVVLFGDGDEVQVTAGLRGLRFLFLSAVPIGEPVAWRGPIVMNTQQELDAAFSEYRNGTFVKSLRAAST